MKTTQVRVLLVEDDTVDRLACRRALAEQPEHTFEFDEVDTARAGLAHVAAEMPDIVLLGYELPDMNGLAFLDAFASTAAPPRAPVIMLAGARDIAIAVDAMRRGASDFLVKDTERDYLKLLPTLIERVLREGRAHAARRLAEVRYRALVEQIPAITYTAALDTPGKLLYVSPQICQLGYSEEAWLASPEGVLHRVHPDDQAHVSEAFSHSYETGEPLSCECRVLASDGNVHWMLNQAQVLSDKDGNPLCMQGVLIDITEKKQREAELDYHRHHLEELVERRTAQLAEQASELRETNRTLMHEVGERKAAEARFRLLLESAGEGIYGLDTEGRCTFVNAAAIAMLGFSREELLGRDTHSMIHHTYPDGRPYPAEACPIYGALRSGIPVRGMEELLWRKDGSSLIAEYSAQPIRDDGRIAGAVLVFHDVTEAHALANHLTYQATHDALTGLVNRQEFERRLERVLEDSQAGGEPYALLYLDLDQFKVVNDTCGHTAGDQLLRQMAERLQDCLRSRDTLARLGGDEFGVLLEHCPIDQALRIATSLRDAVQDFRFVWDSRPFKVGVSIGLVPITAASTGISGILSVADAACYAAKERGRNRVHLYEPDDAQIALNQAQMQWVSRLTHALDADRFLLYHQEIAPIARREGPPRARPHFEILLRLLDEDGLLIEPMAFVPAAERYNLMPAIDRWVIRNVVATQAARHRAACVAERPIFAINLSGTSLSDERLASFVSELLAEHRVPADMLCFEITETAAISNPARAAAFMQALKQQGCLFSLDDFGSGMSSFAYLKQLPVDFLKIDGSFVRTLADDHVVRAMAEAINRIAHVMRIETVAECAETESILALLEELGVDYAQGFALARPVPMAEANDPNARLGEKAHAQDRGD